MAYATVADVEGLMAKRNSGSFSPTTTPSLVKVQAFVDQIGGEVDSVLAAVYVDTPVVAPASFVLFLERVNAMGAAALAEAAQFPEFDGGPGSSPQSQRYWRMYQAMLGELKDGTAIDPSAARSGSITLARSYLTDNPDNDPATDGMTDGQQPAFSMQKVF